MIRSQGHSGVRQAEIIMALALATDLGTGRPLDWALCSAALSLRLGEALGLAETELRTVYYVALLRYIGCTADVETRIQLFGDDPGIGGSKYAFVDPNQPQQMLGWMFHYVGGGQNPIERMSAFAKLPAAMPQHLQAHCEVAQLFTERLGFDPSIRESIWQTYERWDGKGMPRHIQGEALPLATRIAQLAQDVESYRRAGRIEEVIAVVHQRAGSAYDPKIAEVFCRNAERLMTELDVAGSWQNILACEPGQHRYLSNEEFDGAAQVIADFVDLLSPYFTCHSRDVASLASAAAASYGLLPLEAKAVERMGWLHDLGKLSVPLGIWDKPRPLTSSEWERVRLHPYYTERILVSCAGVAELGADAALHHEWLDGSGYPRGVAANALSPRSRLLAAANFYHARREPRPFRESLTPEIAADELRKEVRAGHLDGDAAKAVLSAAGHHVTPVRRAGIAGLSEREIEVLGLLARGRSNRQMARQLGVSENTIGTHVAHIYDKLNVSTRAAATVFAMQHHLLKDTGNPQENHVNT
ncbi:MAG: HD domain-containing phosphohydrolase [Chloroflexota bacterium]